MTAFDDLANALATDSNFSRVALYRAGGVGPEISVRVIFSRPVRDMGFGQTGLAAREMRAQIRLSEIAEPKRGDTLKIDGVIYKVVEPFPDGVNVTATLTLAKATN